MPSISKVRIVNLRYNDDSRVIPDILFCFENSDRQTVNTLLELENGGGKSVLVQLMLQPVIPNASVQGRKITDYFRKTSDCAYILIEWKLDRSNDHLLTGIALAASQNTDENNESKSVRYFTFINHYDNSGDKLDIENFPLSEMINGKLNFSRFSKTRDMIKNSGNAEYFHSDKVKDYQSKLENFGIMHSEWNNILVKINEHEGGIDKFIEAYKTTDDLLNNFIIPGISNSNNKRDAESLLETMFLNYAGSYADKNNKLRLRENISGFINKLTDFQPTVEKLWNLSDKNAHAVRKLFDYIFSLKTSIAKLNETIADLKKQQQEIELQKLHIKTEKLSASYHNYSDQLELAEQQTEKAQKEMDEAKEQYNYYEHLTQVLIAADKYQQLTEAQANEEALTEQKRQLEDDNMNEYAAQLRYSLFLAADNALSETTHKLSENNSAAAEAQSCTNSLTDNINSCKSQKNDIKTSSDKLWGNRETLEDIISKGFEKLDITITKMLDGSFNKKETEDAKNNLNDELASCTREIKLLDNKLNKFEARDKTIHANLLQLTADKQNISQNINKIKELLDEYYSKYNEVKEIVLGFSMSEEEIFSDEPKNYISKCLAETSDKLQKSQRSLEILEQQLKNSEEGTLHLPKSAIEHLTSTGVSYQTGSAYLNQHEGLRTKLLENEPLTAFSIITANDKARKTILEAITDDTWIAAAVPIFTLEDIDRFTNTPSETKHSFITAYSHKYFNDPTSFSEKIRSKITDVKKDISILKKLLTKQKEEQQILIGFDYSSDFKKNNLNKSEELEKNLKDITEKSKKLKAELDGINHRKTEIKEKLTKLSEKKSSINSKITQFNEICDNIKSYYETTDEISKKEQELQELTRKIHSFQNELELLKKQLSDLTEKKTALENDRKEYMSVIDDTKNTEKTKIIEKPYLQLKTEYDQLHSKYSANIQEIEKNLKACRSKISQLGDELKDMGIAESEYSNAPYSSKSYKNATEKKEKFHESLVEKNGKCSNLTAKITILCEKRNDTLEEISKLGGNVLAKSEIGCNFKERIQKCDNEITNVSQKIRKTEDKLRIYSEDLKRAEKVSQSKTDPDPERPPATIELSENMIDDICTNITNCDNALKDEERNALKQIDENMLPFANKNTMFKSVCVNYREIIEKEKENDSTKDWYYTLSEKIESDILTFKKRQDVLDIELKDVEESRKQLVDNCLQRSKKLYEDLNLLTIKSKVKIFGQPRNMIKIELPEVSKESASPQVNMTQYIDDCVKEFLSLPEHEVFKNREKLAHKYMDLRRLLNCYISKEDIPVRVYKIDRTPQSSTFRTWEHSLKANSGGENFVVFFALVLSMMNYSRGISEALNQSSGVLILDNPFGPVSSSHLLDPMFEIAKKFHIQLICLTHLRTTEIVSCFSNVYQLKLKALPLSKTEILEAKPMQHLDCAYYRSEQLSFL